MSIYRTWYNEILLIIYNCVYMYVHLQMDRQSDGELMMDDDHSESKNKACLMDTMGCLQIYCLVGCSLLRECIKLLVNHRRFQQCILLAILINTLSMGIEYHNQVKRRTNDLPFRCYYYYYGFSFVNVCVCVVYVFFM